MKLPRRAFLHLAAGVAALPTITRIARAQAYPTRPLTLIVSFPPVARPTSSRGSLVKRSRSGSASRWSSTTGRAAAAISPCRRSRARRPTATRC
jgi:hypothetical protein